MRVPLACLPLGTGRRAAGRAPHGPGTPWPGRAPGAGSPRLPLRLGGRHGAGGGGADLFCLVFFKGHVGKTEKCLGLECIESLAAKALLH